VYAQTGYQDSESFRSDLLTVLQLQRKIQEDLQGQSAVSDPSLALLENAINEASALTSEELQILQKIDFSLAPAIESLKALDATVTSVKIQSESQAKTATSADPFPCDGYVEAGQLKHPPGPCGQINYQPAEPPLGADQPPIVLTDIEYDDFLTCTEYQSSDFLFTAKKIVIALDITATVARRVCDQIYTVGGVGFNVALVCLVTDLAYLVAERFEHYGARVSSYCHSFRIASEGTSTYVRAGELFVQSRDNTNIIAKRVDEEFEASKAALADVSDRVEENARRVAQTNLILDEIMRTMNIQNGRLFDEDPELD
jgi:hypothetical protein